MRRCVRIFTVSISGLLCLTACGKIPFSSMLRPSCVRLTPHTLGSAIGLLIQAITWQRPMSSQHPWVPVMGTQPVTDHPLVPSCQHFRSSSSSSVLRGNKTNVNLLLVKFTWRDKGKKPSTGFLFQINFPQSLCTPFPGWHLVLTEC